MSSSVGRGAMVPLLVASACANPQVSTDTSVDPDPDTTAEEVADPERDTDVDTEPLPEVDDGCTDTWLAVIGTDPWGREDAVSETVSGVVTSTWRTGRGFWASSLASPITVALAGTDLAPTTTTLAWDGTHVQVSGAGDRSRWAVTTSVATIDGESCATETVWVGLDSLWFAPSASAPTHNRARVLFDGEEGWQAVADALATADTRVTWSTWYWESDFELVRQHGNESASEAARTPNTVLARLEDAGVDTRVLINRFWGDNLDYTAYINTDAALRGHAETSGDGFEVMLQGNATEVPVDGTYDAVPDAFSYADRILGTRGDQRFGQADITGRRGLLDEIDAASWHQKAIVVDGQVAIVTGMNTKAADWDTSDHAVYDSRRMPFDADEDDRLEVLLREEPSELGPRKDYSVRLEGPAAAEVERYFRIRWADALREDALYSEAATPLPALTAAASPSGGVPVQVVATQPHPRLEQSLFETHLRAIEQASDYVLIEDQFFRAPILADALEQRMWDEPDLVLIVITNPVSYWDAGRRWTLDNHERFTVFGDRYTVVQLVASDLYTDIGVLWDTVELVQQPIFNHSKLRLVDDRYLSIGSGNFNNRSYKYEGELSVAILDPTLAADTRAELLAQVVGPDWAWLLSDDAQNNADVLRLAAESNHDVALWWDDDGSDLDVDDALDRWPSEGPSGWAFPVDFGDDWYWDVGPDLF